MVVQVFKKFVLKCHTDVQVVPEQVGGGSFKKSLKCSWYLPKMFDRGSATGEVGACSGGGSIASPDVRR